jgi:PKD repeat protein
MTEKVTNGSFESGTSDWSTDAVGAAGTEVTTTAVSAQCGTYSCLLAAKYNGANGYAEVSQVVDTRCASTLNWYVSYPSGYFHSANTSFRVYVGSTSTLITPTTSWEPVPTPIPVGEKSATTTIKFRLTTTYTTDIERVRVDCVSIDATESAPTAAFSADDTTPTTDDTVTFTNASSAGCPAPMTYAWVFNPTTITYMDATTSTSQHPHVRFDAGGAYTVTLTTTGAAGSDDEVKTDYITVTAAPVADFTVAATGCKPGETIAFQNTTDEGYPAVSAWEWKINSETDPSGTDWEWSDGDSESEEPTVQLNDIGTYDVTLKATNDEGSDTETKVGYLACIGNPTQAAVKKYWGIIIGGSFEK